ncbi:hypothetical protein FB451DRAFT_788424 [Mycena latifolia]|nr:hypothetical protein FB451DRAFT_788424 [Mycena latifolia]
MLLAWYQSLVCMIWMLVSGLNTRQQFHARYSAGKTKHHCATSSACLEAVWYIQMKLPPKHEAVYIPPATELA